MDYTNNPQDNKTPDITNYQFLYELYGLVPGAAPYTPPTLAPSEPSSATAATSSAAADAAPTFEDEDDGPPNDEDKKEKDNKQGRRLKTRRRVAHEDDEPLADWLQAAVDAAKASLEEMNHHPQNQQDATVNAAATTHTNTRGKWRLLGQAPHGESHEIELEHGYRFQVHKLYAEHIQ